MKKYRADLLLVVQGLVTSRERAKRLIMARQVFWKKDNGPPEPVSKPGSLLAESSQFILKEPERFVSRGGYKLLTALDHFQINVSGKTALDVGASTGGFTDCLLQFGAKKVYAVDVGYGQLHWKLRNDPRVVNLERTNIRGAPRGLLPESVHLITLDCSFISIQKILCSCLQYIAQQGILIGLVKPQFELDKGQTSKGVVRSRGKQLRAVQDVVEYGQSLGSLSLRGWVPSSILGPKGNQEYLVVWDMIENN
jgi:23S rRNA (cytidine1920-2'-O)/16S rRNA (cytidine1409-2'-O)-methyltransferase